MCTEHLESNVKVDYKLIHFLVGIQTGSQVAINII